ncbi:hypothetical protein KUV57_13775 [Epibacterium sp. DP7N7-1]|nr:hypothetical protein [Epibacterium sp. DP7N7-1]
MIDRRLTTSLLWYKKEPREDSPLLYAFTMSSVNSQGSDRQDHGGFTALETDQANLLAAGMNIDHVSPNLPAGLQEKVDLSLRQINHGTPVHQWLMEARSGDKVVEIGVMDSATVRLINTASKGSIDLPELLVLEEQMGKLVFADIPDEEAIAKLQVRIEELNPPVEELSPEL